MLIAVFSATPARSPANWRTIPQLVYDSEGLVALKKDVFRKRKNFTSPPPVFTVIVRLVPRACPAGALVRREDGTVNHLQDRCIGCGYCIQACPFKVPQFNPAQNIMRKCSFCTQRIDRGWCRPVWLSVPPRLLAYHPDGEIPTESQAYGKKSRTCT